MRGIADFINVIGADAALDIDQPAPQGVRLSEQEGDQRVHACGGEKHRRVVLWQQRRGGDAFVTALLEKEPILLA
jgi:hypothetical protein